MSDVRFKLRKDTAANWTSVNPVLALGEPGVETDLLPAGVKLKIGDGVTEWNALGYAVDTTSSGGGSFATLSGAPRDNPALDAELNDLETAANDAATAAYNAAVSDAANDAATKYLPLLLSADTTVDAAGNELSFTSDKPIRFGPAFASDLLRPDAAGVVVSSESGTYGSSLAMIYAGDGSGNYLMQGAMRGTLQAPEAVIDGDAVGSIQWAAHDGVNGLISLMDFTVRASGPVSPGNVAGEMILRGGEVLGYADILRVDGAGAVILSYSFTAANFSGSHSGSSSGNNTGDQTSIVGISGTKSEFDGACTDGNFAYQSDLSSYATIAYADSLVVGLLDDRGNYDASGNTFPASGGSGSAGAIKKGDLWTISVAGTLGGTAVTAGDIVRALVDTPGQTAGNWAVSETNIGYTAENVSNKVTSISGASTNTQYPSAKLLYDQLALKVATSVTVNGHPLSSNVSVTAGDLGATTVGNNIFTLTNPGAITFLRVNADNTVTASSAANFKSDLSLTSSDVGLGSVTNDAQTKAAVVPNTAPSAGALLVGNAGGTAYAMKAITGDVTIDSTGATTLATTQGAAHIWSSTQTFGSTLVTSAGVAWSSSATAPAQITTAQAGATATLAASAAVAGSSVAGAAAGGAVTIAAGDAARLTSGNANGGAINLTGGAAIGTGETGQVNITRAGSANAPALTFAGDTQTGFFRSSTNVFNVTINGNSRYAFSSAAFKLGNGNAVQWSSSTIPTGTIDTGLERNAAGVLEINNGASGSYRDLKLRNLLAGGGNGSYVQTPSMTVANLAAASTAGAGARAFVTDATATTFLSTVAGGGANKVPVVSDGTNWLIG